ncbi:hypothetical protein B0J18DRAFT_229022 [Chaetomium sp. MPI-SDFR-AT-0129]|nr:hypothetical protein B0J18DRAFT_229022 [Chaetomium sp. MPI-SDFR-AT-0129]
MRFVVAISSLFFAALVTAQDTTTVTAETVTPTDSVVVETVTATSTPTEATDQTPTASMSPFFRLRGAVVWPFYPTTGTLTRSPTNTFPHSLHGDSHSNCGPCQRGRLAIHRQIDRCVVVCVCGWRCVLLRRGGTRQRVDSLAGGLRGSL